jgi:hypothetical protein
MSARARAWLVSVVLALAWSAAWSQSGGLRVVVVDATDNSPLPGATVTLSSDVQLVPETSALTDSEGRAVFPVLRPGGGYAVEVAMPGFAT